MSRRPFSNLRLTCTALFGAAACAWLGAACSSRPVMQPRVADSAPVEDISTSRSDEGRAALTPQAFEACTGREQGSSCWLYEGDRSLNGDCAPADSDGRLACRAAR